jgi:hypothetical protein
LPAVAHAAGDSAAADSAYGAERLYRIHAVSFAQPRATDCVFGRPVR